MFSENQMKMILFEMIFRINTFNKIILYKHGLK